MRAASTKWVVTSHATITSVPASDQPSVSTAPSPPSVVALPPTPTTTRRAPLRNAAGLDAALDGADLVLTGEGKTDATSFAGKVVGGVLEWAGDLGISARGVIAGQITADARDELSVLGAWAEALVDRVWQSGEAFTRTAMLIEEAAIDLARRAI